MRWFKEKTRTAPLLGVTGDAFMGTFGVSDNTDRRDTLCWMLRQVDLGAAVYRRCKVLEDLLVKGDAEIRGLIGQNSALTSEVADLRELVDSADKALEELDSVVEDLDLITDDLDSQVVALKEGNDGFLKANLALREEADGLREKDKNTGDLIDIAMNVVDYMVEEGMIKPGKPKKGE